MEGYRHASVCGHVDEVFDTLQTGDSNGSSLCIDFSFEPVMVDRAVFTKVQRPHVHGVEADVDAMSLPI